MAVLGKIAKFVLGGGLFGSLLGGGSKPAAAAQGPAQVPVPTRDDARAELARSNALRRRRGAAADMIVNGSAGAEAALGSGKMVLGN